MTVKDLRTMCEKNIFVMHPVKSGRNEASFVPSWEGAADLRPKRLSTEDQHNASCLRLLTMITYLHDSRDNWQMST